MDFGLWKTSSTRKLGKRFSQKQKDLKLEGNSNKPNVSLWPNDN